MTYEKTALGNHQAFNDPKKLLEAMARPGQNEWLRKLADKVDGAFRSSRSSGRS